MERVTGWLDYPRPQLQRDSFLCLNGVWEFCVTAEEKPENASGRALNKIPAEFPEEITVPYPVESELSGIGRHFEKGSVLWYRRRFSMPAGFMKDSLLLHCGAIDQIAEIFVNGTSAGTFITAVDGPLECDVTQYLTEGENELLFRIIDDLDVSIPYGKQTEHPGGMWYTPFSGIWQTVWMESVPEKHIAALRITPFRDRAVIEIEGTGVSTGTVEWEGHTQDYSGGRTEICPGEPRQWTPEMPYLYYFSVKSGEDEVHSYFALRTVTIENTDGIPRICLNGKPFFFHGLLDQGYFRDGICTPYEPSAYKRDILAAKRMGFNTLRKHIKIEPEVFYYECDRLGMIVLQDMVNSGPYNFLQETALPTVGFLKKNDMGREKDPDRAVKFRRSVDATLRRLFNHPCICCWTVFNEGWGQFDSSVLYDAVKAEDPTRIIDSASGWFTGGKSDVCSVHVYFRKFRMPRRQDTPVVLSEFGGYVLKEEGHSFSRKDAYGYRFYKDRAAFMADLEKLYMTEILPAVKKGLCGAIYTQLSDVEDELNGLMTYDRKVVKADEPRMRAIAEELSNACAGKGKESDV